MGRNSVVAGSLMAYLPTGDADFLRAQGVRRSFAEDAVIMNEGDPTDHVLVLIGGWVRISTALPDGQEVLLALRGPGDVIGELAALHGWPRSASVRCLEPVAVVQFRANQFLACLRTRPEIAVALLKTLSARMREAEGARIDGATLDVSRRVAVYLLRLATQHGKAQGEGIVLDLPLTQQDVANRIGASRRAVARSLAVLRDRSVVLTSRRRIEIARPDVLRSLAGVPNGTYTA